MAEQWILNASPFIALAHVGHEQLFAKLADAVAAPEAVIQEILAGPPEDRARQIVEARQLKVVQTPPAPPEIVAWDLGAGETAVLTWALAHPEWTVILDDAAARNCAKSFNLCCKGTLGIIILAQQRGIIPSAAAVLRTLVANGFRLDDDVIRVALARTVGETW